MDYPTVSLIECCMYDNIDKAKVLIRDGADVNEIEDNGKTSLIWSMSKEMTKLLLESGASDSINIADDNGYTALMYSKNIEMTTLLLEAGADVNAKANNGYTALMRTRDVEMTKALLEAGADVKASDDNGYTALMRSYEVETNILLDQYGDDYSAFDSDSYSKLNVEMARVLLEAGAEVNPVITDLPMVLRYDNPIEMHKLLMDYDGSSVK
jgi:ankyrin repeat protein